MKLGLQKAQLAVNSRGELNSEIDFLTGEHGYIDMDTMTWRDQGSKHGVGKDSLNKYLEEKRSYDVNFFLLDVLIISAISKHIGEHRAVVLYDLDMLFI